MPKAVLLSIKPKYCEFIANGKKTIEVRKTKPKLEPPFKCYIYCTKPKMITKYVFKPEDYPEYMRLEKVVFCKLPDASSPFCSTVNGNGKVIAEFVCDEIFPMSITYSDPNHRLSQREFPFTCLTDKEIMNHLGNGKTGYGWHISNLVIYDKPRELGEFTGLRETKFGAEPVTIKRAPQSWCYVEAETRC